MRVHLADVSGVPDPFHSRIPTRARMWRNDGTGSGGGAPEKEESEEETEEEEEETEEEEKPEDTAAELEKLKRTNKRRETALRKAQEENARLRAEKEKPEGEPDPVAKANARLLNASARTVLAASGITDKDDQKLIISMISFTDVEIDDEDGPDEEAIEEKIDELRRIFGATTKPASPGSRTPRGVKAPERGRGGTADPDASRYARILGTRP